MEILLLSTSTIELLSNVTHCPFCGALSVITSNSRTQTIGKKYGLQKIISASRSSQKQYVEKDYATRCKCDTCKEDYYYHGFNMINVQFFNDRFDVTKSVDASPELREEYNDIQSIFSDINWDKGALLCQQHKKKGIFHRKNSILYYFFVIHKDSNILKITTDFVTSSDGRWGKLYLIAITFAKRMEV